jgi:plasmid stabilization system protein ParE
MAQKIEWTKPALNDLRGIIEYYFPLSQEYSSYLYIKIIQNVNFISEHPFLGNPTTYKNLRIKIVLKR